MKTPIHKTCYRCGVPTRDLVDSADPLGGAFGCCEDCRQRMAAAQAALEWRLKRDAAPEVQP